METKQVIVLRKDLNMRKGKMIAQGAHACLGACKKAKTVDPEALALWEKDGQTKIVVGVDSEQELLDIYVNAAGLGIPAAIITDAGRTEFNGVPTKTAVAIGPAEVSKIDQITRNLSLL
jgi:PTH2 family peptidyl-tRNA hydrolase